MNRIRCVDVSLDAPNTPTRFAPPQPGWARALSTGLPWLQPSDAQDAVYVRYLGDVDAAVTSALEQEALHVGPRSWAAFVLGGLATTMALVDNVAQTLFAPFVCIGVDPPRYDYHELAVALDATPRNKQNHVAMDMFTQSTNVGWLYPRITAHKIGGVTVEDLGPHLLAISADLQRLAERVLQNTYLGVFHAWELGYAAPAFYWQYARSVQRQLVTITSAPIFSGLPVKLSEADYLRALVPLFLAFQGVDPFAATPEEEEIALMTLLLRGPAHVK